MSARDKRSLAGVVQEAVDRHLRAVADGERQKSVERAGEGDRSELWWRGNVIDQPLEQDEMQLAANDGERHVQVICDALLDKGDIDKN